MPQQNCQYRTKELSCLNLVQNTNKYFSSLVITDNNTLLDLQLDGVALIIAQSPFESQKLKLKGKFKYYINIKIKNSFYIA